MENQGTPPAAAPVAAAPPPASLPTPTTTPTNPQAPGTPSPASAPQTVTIPIEQLQAYTQVQQRLLEVDAELKRRDAEARAEQVKLLQARGETEKAMQLQQEEARRSLEAEKVSRAAAEARAQRFALDSELSKVLASQPLVAGGAEQLTMLWRNQFQVTPEGDSYAVRTPTFQSVNDFVTAQLASPGYAHFLQARNPNGGTSGGPTSAALSPSTPANPAAPPAPKNFGEAIILQMQQVAKEQPSDPRLNTAVAMGLNSRSMVRNA